MVLRKREDEQPFEERDNRKDMDTNPESAEQLRSDRPGVLRLQREEEGIEPPERVAEGYTTTEHPADGARQMFVPGEESGTFRSRWQDIQMQFVDDPRDAVSSADALLSEITNRIAQRLREERTQLEQGWKQGKDPTTEDLRLALQRYHSFFDRLLAS